MPRTWNAEMTTPLGDANAGNALDAQSNATNALQAVPAKYEIKERSARIEGERLDWNDITIYPWCMGCRSAQPAKSTDRHANVLPRRSKTASERAHGLRPNAHYGACMRQRDDARLRPALPGLDRSALFEQRADRGETGVVEPWAVRYGQRGRRERARVRYLPLADEVAQVRIIRQRVDEQPAHAEPCSP